MNIVKEFEKIFGESRDEIKKYYAPGRINLIGEHVDYNGGYVLPCPIDRGIYAAVSQNGLQMLRLYSVNYEELGIVEIDLESLKTNELRSEAGKMGWFRYPLGVFLAMVDRGFAIEDGLDILFFGELPQKVGLASSAALEAVTAFMLRDMLQLEIDDMDMAFLCQRAEREYGGVNCGIMDQFASIFGRQGSLVLLNTDTMEYEHIDEPEGNYKLILTESKIERNLTGTGYNRTIEKSREAGDYFEKLGKTRLLSRLTLDDMMAHEDFLRAKGLYPIVRHMIEEDLRTQEAARCLRGGDFLGIGKLLNESHASLRDNMKVSCEQLDFLARESQKIPGVLGSRMMGAGFGGCVLSITEGEQVDKYKEEIRKLYRSEEGLEAEIHCFNTGVGARKLT